MGIAAGGLLLLSIGLLAFALRERAKTRATLQANEQLRTRIGELRNEAALERAKFQQLRNRLV